MQLRISSIKTHKLTPNEIFEKPIHDIPVRLLQAAGNIATSRLTAVLEHIFKLLPKIIANRP